MAALILILVLALPFVLLGALVMYLTITIGRQTRGGK
jgi:hypothetical protein